MRIPTIVILNIFLFVIVFAKITYGKTTVSILEPIKKNKTVRTGLDVLIEDHLNYLDGKKIGLVTNHSGITRNGVKNYTIFQKSTQIELSVIFAPEHGFYGEASAGAKVEYQNKTGPNIISLYGRNRRPTQDMVEGLDLIIYDIQDIGARFYTYISTLAMTMEVAAENNINVMILDRPNPLGGEIIEGATLDPNYKSFIGYYPIPTRYGLTVGELSYMACNNNWLSSSPPKLIIVKMDNWKRSMYYNDTKLSWVKPSPNIPDIETAIIYPGMCLYEATNISEGRGTNQPFKLIGAPWMDTAISEQMETVNLKGASFNYASFKPKSLKGKSENPKYKDTQCQGFKVKITKRKSFQSIISAVRSLEEIYSLYEDVLELNELRMKQLWGNDQIIRLLKKEIKPKQFFKELKKDEKVFKRKSKPYLLYN